MIVCILLSLLILSNSLFGMELQLNEQELQKFVQSYSIVKEIPHEGGATYSLLYDAANCQLIAGTYRGLGAWNCKDYTCNYFDIYREVSDLTQNQKKDMLYFRTLDGGFSRNVHGSYKKVINSRVDALTYNTSQEKLCSGIVNKFKILDPAQEGGSRKLYSCLVGPYDGRHNIRAMCCDEANDLMYVGLGNGIILMLNGNGTHKKSVQVAPSRIDSLQLDKNQNCLWIKTGEYGTIRQCNTNLENIKKIPPVGVNTVLAFAHDDSSNLLCISSEKQWTENSLHIISPDNADIKLEIPLECNSYAITSDPDSSTFYVGTCGKILILKPKIPFKMLPHG